MEDPADVNRDHTGNSRIVGDGAVRNLEIDLASHPKYRGAMTQIKLQLAAGKGSATIYAVELRRSQSSPTGDVPKAAPEE